MAARVTMAAWGDCMGGCMYFHSTADSADLEVLPESGEEGRNGKEAILPQQLLVLM